MLRTNSLNCSQNNFMDYGINNTKFMNYLIIVDD